MPKREDKPDTVVYAAREPGIHLNGRLEVQEDLIWLNARDNKEQLVSVQLQVKDKIRVQTFILSKTLPVHHTSDSDAGIQLQIQESHSRLALTALYCQWWETSPSRGDLSDLCQMSTLWKHKK